MAREGPPTSADAGVQPHRQSGGIQLPMELSFITVDKPGQRIPYSQISQITAHAMRKSHERRRALDSISIPSQQSRQQGKRTTSESSNPSATQNQKTHRGRASSTKTTTAR